MRRAKLLLLLLWCILTTGLTPAVQAAVGEESMVMLTTVGGLTGETVHRVMTSHNGGMWIATNSGVNAFNGKQLLSFRIKDEEGNFLSVYDLCETRNHHIYAAADNGLYRIAHGQDDFEHILPEVQHPISLLAVGDTVYIGSNQGLMIYDGEHLTHVDISPSRQGLDNIVRQYVMGDDGLIWFLGRYDLNSYHPKTGKTVRYELNYTGKKPILTQFAVIGQGRFVIGTRGQGLFLYDINTKALQPVPGIGNIVMSVQKSADGSICVATDGTGAYRLDIKNETLNIIEHFHSQGDCRHRLPSNGVYSYYRDKNGVNWFGFVRHGLAYTYYSGDLFRVFSLPLAPSKERGSNEGVFTTDGMNVRTYCRQGDDAIIGTQNGFYHVNVATGMSRYYPPEELKGGYIVNCACWYQDRFYLGTFDGGLRVFDPKTQTVSLQTFTPLLDNISIGDLKTGPDGRLWIGCTHGLIIVNNGQVEQHFTEQNSRIVGGLILSITFDASDNAWLTGATGCSLYSERSYEIVEANFPKGFFNQQPWMRGAKGHDGLVFMRTGPKTFYTNEQMTDFGELKLPVTFIDKWCRQFVDDMKGHYLIASELGVFCFSYDQKEMLHFGYGEGLRGDFINDMGIEPDGQLWVATSQGLFFSDLQRLDTWKKSEHNKVRLFNIRRGSDLLSSAESYAANATNVIRIGWNLTSEVLQFEPVLMDYAKQTGRQYEYRIGGDDWQLADNDNPIRLTHLELGKNRLEIRLAGVEGSVSVYTITVVPTTWAVIELILLVVAMGLLWIGWRFRKQTMVLLTERDEIEDALVAAEEQLQDISLTSDLSPLTSEKYQKVKIDEDECAAIVKRMKEYLNRERVYTNADLKMKDLADVLHLSAPKLSQVFNLYMGQNYYDFINQYRLAEFKRLIDEGEYKRYTITALSEQCGFKKSNFFTTFRKVEGMTPVEYLKRMGVKTNL